MTIIFCSSSCSNFEALDNSKASSGNRGSYIIKNNDTFFYCSSNDGKGELYEYNTISGESKKIDDIKFSPDLFGIDNVLYYVDWDEENIIHIYSYDKNKICDEGSINDEEYISMYDFQIFKYKNKLFILQGNQLMQKDKNSFEVVADNITSITVNENIIYYADLDGNIHEYNGQEDVILLSNSVLLDNEWVKSILAGEYDIHYLCESNGELYFIVGPNADLGKVFKYSDNELKMIMEDGAASKISVSNGRLYYYDLGCKRIVVNDGNGNVTEIKEIPEGASDFCLEGDTVYYAYIENNIIKYYKWENGAVSEIFKDR